MSHHHCNHHSHHHHHHVGESKNILFAFFLNMGFSVIEFIGGYYTNSVAVTSDALHDFGDSLALLFSYFAEKIGQRPRDKKFTFGLRRFSVLAAFFNGVILLSGSIYVIYQAILRLQNPQPIHATGMLGLAVLGVLVNGLAAYRLSKNEGINSKMISLHLIEDLLGWLAVLLVGVVLLFKPWFVLDAILSILISLLILRGVYQNFRKIGSILLQMFPEEIDQDSLINAIKQIDQVDDIHFVQGWSLDSNMTNLTLHVKVSSELKMREVDSIRIKIEEVLRKGHVAYFTIQFESDNCSLSVAQFKPSL